MKRLAHLAVLLGLAACDGSATNVAIDYGRPSVLVEVSGGIAAADFAYVHASPGVLIGVRCRALCDFAAGDTLFVLSGLQSERLAQALYDSGAWQVDGLEDFGVPCCDQFAYRMTFTDESRQGVVLGTAESLPDGYVRLARLLEGFRRGIAPILVQDGPRIEGYPHDEVDIMQATLDAPILTLQVRYGGGCARHDFDLLALPGWRESWPVQVDVDLAHDGHDDPCDALPTANVRFDLTPLREAYEEAYGVGTGAVALHLGPASGGARTVIEWRF